MRAAGLAGWEKSLRACGLAGSGKARLHPYTFRCDSDTNIHSTNIKENVRQEVCRGPWFARSLVYSSVVVYFDFGIHSDIVNSHIPAIIVL